MNWQWILTTLIAVAGLGLSLYNVIRNAAGEKMNIVINNGQVIKSWEYNKDNNAYLSEVYFDIINRSRSPITINNIVLEKAWVVYDNIWINRLNLESSPALPVKLTEHEEYRLHVELETEGRIPNPSELVSMRKMSSILHIYVDTSRGRFRLYGSLSISAIMRLGKVEGLSQS
jgi:hypothetical protein